MLRHLNSWCFKLSSLLVQTYPTFKSSFTVAHFLSTLMRHLFGSCSHSSFIRGFKQMCLFLLNIYADSPWEAKCQSKSFTQPSKVKAINILTLFDNFKSFAWRGYPRGTTQAKHTVLMASCSSDYISQNLCPASPMPKQMLGFSSLQLTVKIYKICSWKTDSM